MDYFKILPAEITLNILVRLPTESVLECKLVSTNWRNLVTSRHPSFSKMHLGNLLNHPSVSDSANLDFIVCTFDDDDNRKFHYFEYNDENTTSPPILRIRRMNLTSPFRDYHRFFGSCNGLICLASGQSVCISNPITREVIMFPEITSKKDCCILYCRCWETGFGYVSSTNEYKIVVICTRETKFVEVYVYTLGSGNGWRKLGSFDFKSSKEWLPGIFVNGVLYWLDRNLKMVITFDMEQEKFCENIPLPPLPIGGDWNENTIEVLDGFLFYDARLVVHGCGYYEIWLLRKKNRDMIEPDERCHQSFGWSKEFRVDESMSFAVTKKGDGVLTHIGNYVNIYDTKTSTSKRLVKFKGSIRVFPHRNTFVSLKELGEEDTIPMESVDIEESDGRDYTFQQLEDDAFPE